MLEYTFKLDYDTVDKIVIDQLTNMIDQLQHDLDSRRAGDGFAIFSTDLVADISEMEKHINAAKVILEYYGGAQ